MTQEKNYQSLLDAINKYKSFVQLYHEFASKMFSTLRECEENGIRNQNLPLLHDYYSAKFSNLEKSYRTPGFKGFSSEKKAKVCQNTYKILSYQKNCESIMDKYINTLTLLNKVKLKEDTSSVKKYVYTEVQNIVLCFRTVENLMNCQSNLLGDNNDRCDNTLANKEVNFIGSDFNATAEIDMQSTWYSSKTM